MDSEAILIKGELQKEGGVIHIIAEEMDNLTPELGAALDGQEPQTLPAHKSPTHNLWKHPRDTSVLPKGRNFH